MKIYVVTSGTYSDYHISAVFTDKIKADAYVAMRGSDAWISDATIEEWDTSDDYLELDHNNKLVYLHFVNDARNHIYPEDKFYVTITPVFENNINQFLDKDFHADNIKDSYVILPERNEEKAIKIYQDRVAKRKAAESGIV